MNANPTETAKASAQSFGTRRWHKTLAKNK
jgi:hypothetical protein